YRTETDAITVYSITQFVGKKLLGDVPLRRYCFGGSGKLTVIPVRSSSSPGAIALCAVIKLPNHPTFIHNDSVSILIEQLAIVSHVNFGHIMPCWRPCSFVTEGGPAIHFCRDVDFLLAAQFHNRKCIWRKLFNE